MAKFSSQATGTVLLLRTSPSKPLALLHYITYNPSMKCPHCSKTISFVKHPHPGSKPRVDYELIRKLKKSGLSYRAIAQKASCSIYSVSCALAADR